MRIVPFFAYAPEIGKVIYITNAIESVNFSLRRLIRTCAAFPSDEVAIELPYLGLRNVGKCWTTPTQNWKRAMRQLMILFDKTFNPT